MTPNKNKKIAILVSEDVEDLEYYVPMMRLVEEGYEVLTAAMEKKTLRGKHSLEITPNALISELKADELAAVVLPGGWAPDKLRRYKEVTGLVAEMYKQKKIIASICHGGWIPISAGVVKGHKATGTIAIKDDLVNAGAIWVDEPAFREGNFVWGQVVKDIPAFNRELVKALKSA